MSYYKEKIPDIIDRLKTAIEQCLVVIAQPITTDLADDKLHAVLKGKRMASEDVKFYAKEVDILKAELEGTVIEADREDSNLIKQFTKQ